MGLPTVYRPNSINVTSWNKNNSWRTFLLISKISEFSEVWNHRTHSPSSENPGCATVSRIFEFGRHVGPRPYLKPHRKYWPEGISGACSKLGLSVGTLIRPVAYRHGRLVRGPKSSGRRRTADVVEGIRPPWSLAADTLSRPNFWESVARRMPCRWH